MQIAVVLASNALFLIAYSFALASLSFGINSYTILKHNVSKAKIKEFVENLPYFMRIWYMMHSAEEFRGDPIKMLQALPYYNYTFSTCVIGTVLLLLCLFTVIAVMLFSIRIRDSLTVLNCVLVIVVFFGGIGWVWYQNNKLLNWQK